METARAYSLLFGIASVALFYWQRRRVLDLTCTGAFFLSYFVFVYFGVLAAPWVVELILKDVYSYVLWDEIPEAAFRKAIVVCAAGLSAALAGHVCMDWIRTASGRKKIVRGFFLRGPIFLSLGYNPPAVMLVFLLAAACGAALAMPYWRELLRGFYDAYILGNSGVYYQTRFLVQGIGFVYYQIVHNVLPFLAILAWVGHQYYRNDKKLRRQAFLYLIVCCLFFLTTFEKLPLLIFLLFIALAQFSMAMARDRVRVQPKDWQAVWRRTVDALRRGRLIRWAPPLFLILVVLYSLSTGLQFGAGGASRLFLLSASRIFDRQPVATIMYSSYFPERHPHYGLRNIGKLSFLFDDERVADTVLVLRAYTRVESGSAAIHSLGDLYSGFGWPGLLAGAFSIGLLLNILDRRLALLKATCLNRAFWLTMLMSAYFLSQASIARTLSSYGAGVFVFLWLFLSAERVFHLAVSKRHETLATNS